jgi:hypothetical protein
MLPQTAQGRNSFGFSTAAVKGCSLFLPPAARAPFPSSPRLHRSDLRADQGIGPYDSPRFLLSEFRTPHSEFFAKLQFIVLLKTKNSFVSEN